MPRPLRVVVVTVTIFALVGLLLAVERVSISHQVDDQKCKLRLRLLARAVNTWVVDHGYRSFPVITNPPPGALWQPDRIGSASVVLQDYLEGDVPPIQREDETDAAFLERRRLHAVTVDPATGFPFWYNAPTLSITDPSRLASGEIESRWYFRSQRDPDGNWPYRDGGETGTWLAVASGAQRQITASEVAELRTRLQEIEARNAGKPRNEWTHDLDTLRAQVASLESALAQSGEGVPDGERVITRVTLIERVIFTSGSALAP